MTSTKNIQGFSMKILNYGLLTALTLFYFNSYAVISNGDVMEFKALYSPIAEGFTMTFRNVDYKKGTAEIHTVTYPKPGFQGNYTVTNFRLDDDKKPASCEQAKKIIEQCHEYKGEITTVTVAAGTFKVCLLGGRIWLAAVPGAFVKHISNYGTFELQSYSSQDKTDCENAFLN